ncbi:MAG TPA: hypothetical protein VLD37_05570 [Candidatus Bilamarchaeum sp.]|nr:hypothetical protein [Candidatus Bilamarchaeum sp.]
MTSKLKCGIAAAAVVSAVYLARAPSQEVSKFKPEPATIQCADMPAPSYSWASSLGNFLSDRSKKSEYSGL